MSILESNINLRLDRDYQGKSVHSVPVQETDRNRVNINQTAGRISKTLSFSFLLYSLFELFFPHLSFAIPAFPGAEGYGSETVGGRKGRVIEVVNTDDSGPGSLRQALEVETGPRIVVFRVGGTIPLKRPIAIKGANSFVTVAGQTAPGDGIQLKNFGLLLKDGAHDIVLRHLRIRPGMDGLKGSNGNNIDAMEFYGADTSKRIYNVVVDHVSMQWAVDENTSTWGHVRDVTFQYSIIAEGSTEGHPEGSHSAGFISGLDSKPAKLNTLSIHHSLFAHNMMRNPRIKMSQMDFRNNVVYDWTECGTAYFTDGTRFNFVNNIFLKGPATPNCNTVLGMDGTTKTYLSGNYTPQCPTGCSDNWQIGVSGNRNSLLKSSLATPPVTTDQTAAVLETVLAKAGAVRPVRDEVDQRIVNDVVNKTGNIGIGSDYPTLNSDIAPTDTDHDGMPDSWELEHGLDPNDASDGNADLNQNGYTDLEDYLNELGA